MANRRPAAAQGFHVELIEDRGRVRVVVAGELDLVTGPVLQRHVDGALGRERPEIEVDLSGVTFIDVRGVNVLVAGHAAAAEAGTRFVVRGGHRIRRLVELCELQDTLVLEDVRGPG